MVDKLKLTPELKLYNSDNESVVKFSFVVHPLSANQIFKHPLLKLIKPKLTGILKDTVEDVMSLSPGLYYGKIEGYVVRKW